MKKSFLIGLFVFSLVALLVVGGTMAWFTDTKEASNKFTAGTVKIQILENGQTNPVVKENVNPGDIYDKEVKVESLGSKRTYVRVSINPVWEGNLPINNVNLIFADGELGTHWVDGGDGWYYYKHILAAGAVTEPLLSKVEIIGSLTGDDYQGKKLTVNVKAEAVQASHEAYKDAWGLSNMPTGIEPWTE